jgi:hypothetical protein
MLTAGTARSAQIWEDPNGWLDSHFSYDRSGAPKFSANELSLDLFGSYSNPESSFGRLTHNDLDRGFWGGGVGVNYFFIPQFGIGSDVNLSAHSGNIVDQVMGNAILRLPIESASVAPYIFGGAGRGISPAWEWVWDAGAGVEFRLNSATGIFVDARYIWADESTDRIVFRAGLRLVF